MKNTFRNLSLALCLCLPAGMAVTMVGCASDDPHKRTAGEYIDDQTLHVRVKKALSDNGEYKFGDVNVTSFRGVVQLAGFVNTPAQKKVAGDAAQRVQGARSVENNITVKEKL